MKCVRCNRELTQHHESGMGAICQMKANNSDGAAEIKTIVQLVYNNHRGHRNYSVKTADGKAFVTVSQIGADRIGKCFCLQGKAQIKCSHLDAVAAEDKRLFPLPVSAYGAIKNLCARASSTDFAKAA